MALCEVLGVTIESCYPKVGNDFIKAMYNTELISRKHQGDEFSICILWSHSGNLDNKPGATYEPNHLAPIFKSEKTKKTKTTSGLSSLDSSSDADSQGNVKLKDVKATTITAETKTKTERLPRAEKVDTLDNTSSTTPQRKTDKLSDISDKKQASTKTTKGPVKDIGLFKVNQMSDAEKFGLLQNVWKPQQDFKFPSKL